MINEGFVQGVPHNAAMGLEMIDYGPGVAVSRLPWAPRLVGNPDTGVLHGGAITSMIDATCGAAVFMGLRAPTRIATLDLRIDYLGPATARVDVLARAHCYKITRRIAFVRGVAYHEDPDAPIASCAGTFMVFRGDHDSELVERMRERAR